MNTKQPKNLMIMNILDILRKKTDENHRLSQKEIMDALQTEYGMEVERKSVKRNLMNLIDFGYRVNYSETVRVNRNGEEESIYSDWYLDRDFSDAELRLIIDSLLFSKHIPRKQCKELISKIEGLSSEHFASKVRHVCNLPENHPQNPELFYTIELLDEAIEHNKQVVFHYGDFGVDKQLHLRTDDNGAVREYVVNPYQMVATNGKYYLIGNYDKYDNISHYRLDHIRDIQVLESPAKEKRDVIGMEHGLNLPEHMAEHIYMFSGESERVTLKTTPNMATELVDWFGNGVTFTDITEESVIAHVKVNRQAMRFWALQYAPYVTVLQPVSLAEQIAEDLKTAVNNYSKEDGNE